MHAVGHEMLSVARACWYLLCLSVGLPPVHCFYLFQLLHPSIWQLLTAPLAPILLTPLLNFRHHDGHCPEWQTTTCSSLNSSTLREHPTMTYATAGDLGPTSTAAVQVQIGVPIPNTMIPIPTPIPTATSHRPSGGPQPRIRAWELTWRNMPLFPLAG